MWDKTSKNKLRAQRGLKLAKHMPFTSWGCLSLSLFFFFFFFFLLGLNGTMRQTTASPQDSLCLKSAGCTQRHQDTTTVNACQPSNLGSFRS